MASFLKGQNISHFQEFIREVYGLPNDRIFSIWDLLTQQQRFAMRALKGIRKDNPKKIKENLVISFSFLVSISNRLHIDLEDEVWERFPGLCSYCGQAPCACKRIKPTKRLKLKVDHSRKPATLKGFQMMFDAIYPSSKRTLADAGVHLAEEVGEVSEAVHNFLGQHLQKQFDDVRLEIADCVSCIFGVANSANIDMEHELATMFRNNCHVCHEAPCVCNFTVIAQIRT